MGNSRPSLPYHGGGNPTAKVSIPGYRTEVNEYTVDTVELLVPATSLIDVLIPESGTGFFYLVRPDCPVGSWQTVVGAEPGRDLALSELSTTPVPLR